MEDLIIHYSTLEFESTAEGDDNLG